LITFFKVFEGHILLSVVLMVQRLEASCVKLRMMQIIENLQLIQGCHCNSCKSLEILQGCSGLPQR